VLFSGFLSALRQFASVDQGSTLTEIEFEGQPVKVNFDETQHINSLEFSNMELIFHYLETDEVTIAVGGSTGKNIDQDTQILRELVSDIEKFMQDWKSVDWSNVTISTLDELEASLLGGTVHPFLRKHNIVESCALGKNCPYRLAWYEGIGDTIYDKIENMITKVRSKNIMKTMFFMMTGRIAAMFERRKYAKST